MNKYFDGFEWLATTIGSSIANNLMAEAGWFITEENGQGLAVGNGRFNYGKSIAVNRRQINGFRTRYIKTLPDLSTPSEGYQGFAMLRSSGGDPNGWLGFCFSDAANNTPQLSITFGRNGVVRVFRGLPPQGFDAGGTVLGSSKAGVFDEDAWFYAECHAVIDNGTSGSFEVRINTVPVLQVVSVDTSASGTTYFDSIGMICGAPPSTALNVIGNWDDHYVNDALGAQNNSWLGNVRTKTQFMTANGATDNFLIGGSSPAPTNWQSVLNQNIDDTEYVYSANAGDIDLYVPDPIINAPLVHAVQLRSALRQDDATQREAKHLIRIGGVNYENSVLQFTDQLYAHYFSRWDLNPATGVSFTGADVNGFQAGVKLQV